MNWEIKKTLELYMLIIRFEEIVNSPTASCKNPRITPDGLILTWWERTLKKPFPGPHQVIRN